MITNAPELAKVMINIVIYHHSFSNSILINKSSVFTFKFWSLLCYFFRIKRKLSTAFYSQIDKKSK